MFKNFKIQKFCMIKQIIQKVKNHKDLDLMLSNQKILLEVNFFKFKLKTHFKFNNKKIAKKKIIALKG